MSTKGMTRIYLFHKFERFHHWVQALLILVLLLTGFEIHGTYRLFGFDTAYSVHNFCAWSWLILYAFGVFWLATTGEWKQYTPTAKKLVDMVMYYSVGIFRGDPHPVPKSQRAKHNPLQRLTYLAIVSVLVPYQMITGFLYHYYNDWTIWGLDWGLAPIAVLHTIGAFAFLTFLIVHIYMATTGHTIFAHIKAMITGWDEVEENGENESTASSG